MSRATAARNGQQLWHYLPRLPRPVFFYAGVHFACMATWLVLWLLNSRDTLHLVLAGVFAALGLAHVAVECLRARRTGTSSIGLDKSQDHL